MPESINISSKEVSELLGEIKTVDSSLYKEPVFKVTDVLNKRNELFDTLIKKATEKEFTILRYVKFFNDRDEIACLKGIVECAGGFFAPHSSGGFSMENVDVFHIFIPPFAVSKIEKHETIFGGRSSSDYNRETTILLTSGIRLSFHESYGNASEIKRI